MTKHDLVVEVQEALADMGAPVTRPEAQRAVEAVMGEIGCAVADGETVQVSEFGKFFPRRKAARRGRNPKTGEPVVISARTVPVFRPSPHLKAAVDVGW